MMPVYNAPVRDMKFIMQEMLNIGDLTKYKKFAEADIETLDAIIDHGAKFASEVLAPLNVIGDKEGCTRHRDGSVSTPTGFKEAYAMMVENGMLGLSASPEYGGMG
ncbi:MAG: acyl-CoA dehydrogenase N-terminal domain-containing protein, partial [Hellea sp.]